MFKSIRVALRARVATPRRTQKTACGRKICHAQTVRTGTVWTRGHDTMPDANSVSNVAVCTACTVELGFHILEIRGPPRPKKS